MRAGVQIDSIGLADGGRTAPLSSQNMYPYHAHSMPTAMLSIDSHYDDDDGGERILRNQAGRIRLSTTTDRVAGHVSRSAPDAAHGLLGKMLDKLLIISAKRGYDALVRFLLWAQWPPPTDLVVLLEQLPPHSELLSEGEMADDAEAEEDSRVLRSMYQSARVLEPTRYSLDLTMLQSNLQRNCSRGRTALMWAAETQRYEIARMLLSRGALVNHHAPMALGGVTALMLAVQQDDVEMAGILLEVPACQSHIDAEDAHGWTALMLSYIFAEEEMQEKLLDHGANPDHISLLRVNEDEEDAEASAESLPATILMRAAYLGDEFVVASIIIDICQQQTCQTLDVAAGAMCLASSVGVVTLLCSLGANADVVMGDGKTMLMWAAYLGHTEVVDYYLRNQLGGEPNARCAQGHTALEYAFLKHHTPAVRLLLPVTLVQEQAFVSYVQRSIDESRVETLRVLLGQSRADIRMTCQALLRKALGGASYGHLAATEILVHLSQAPVREDLFVAIAPKERHARPSNRWARLMLFCLADDDFLSSPFVQRLMLRGLFQPEDRSMVFRAKALAGLERFVLYGAESTVHDDVRVSSSSEDESRSSRFPLRHGHTPSGMIRQNYAYSLSDYLHVFTSGGQNPICGIVESYLNPSYYSILRHLLCPHQAEKPRRLFCDDCEQCPPGGRNPLPDL